MESNSQCPNCRAELPFNIADQIVLAREKGQCAACPYCSCNLEFFQQVQPQASKPNCPNEQVKSVDPPPFQRYHPYKPEPPATSWLGAQVPMGEKRSIPQEKRSGSNSWKKLGIVAALSLAALISFSGFVQSALGRQIFQGGSSSGAQVYPIEAPEVPEAPQVPEAPEWPDLVLDQYEFSDVVGVPADLGETMFLYDEAKSISLTIDAVEDLGNEVGDFEADLGSKIMGVDFTMGNDSEFVSTMYLDIKFISIGGHQISTAPLDYTGLINDQATSPMMVRPGDEISGTLYFTVPEISNGNYTISIESDDPGKVEQIRYVIPLERDDID